MNGITSCTERTSALTPSWDKPKENFHLTLQLYGALQHLSAPCFGFMVQNFTVWIASHQLCFQQQQPTVPSQTALITSLYTTCSAPNCCHTKLATSWLISQHLAAERPDILNQLKGEIIINKWMLLLYYVSWICKGPMLFGHLPYQLYKGIMC